MKTSSIQYAIKNNTVEALVKDWAETEYRTSIGKPVFKGDWTLEQHYDFCNKKVDDVRAEMGEEAQQFTLALNYNDFENRSLVKSLGGKWDATNKTWSVSFKPSKYPQLAKLANSNKSRGYKSIFGASADGEEDGFE